MHKHQTGTLALAGALALMTACSPSAQLTKKADKKFREQAAYNEAADLYKQALDKGGNKAYLNGQIGESYYLSNRPAVAAPFYKAALDAGNKADSLKFHYAEALRDAGQNDEAKAAFSDYVASGRRQKWVDRAKMEVKNIDMIPQLQAQSAKQDYDVKPVDAINTAAAEFGPVLENNNQEITFTAARGGKIYAQNGQPFLKLYSIKTDALSGQPGASAVSQPAPAPAPPAQPGQPAPAANPAPAPAPAAAANGTPWAQFNTDNHHEASATFSKDGSMVVFARSNDGSRKGPVDVDLYMSKKSKDGVWSEPEMLSISSASAWDAFPALSPDGKTLYFSSNRGGESAKGGNDLYSATYAEGKFGNVKNLGSSINTAGDEESPYVSEDGKLYFASNGQPGFGGLDLFMASREGGNTSVTNLGQPVNSKADDFGITMKNAYEGYFSSNRAGGKGDDDIYYFKNVLAEPKIVKYHVKGSITGVSGGQNAGALEGAKVHLTDGNNPAGEATTDAQGNFNLPVEENKEYTVLVEKDGYFTKRDVLSTQGKRPDVRQLKGNGEVNDIEIPYSGDLAKIKLEERIVVENIYYGYDSSDIRPSAAVELDKIVTMLNDNPNITIELSSHTDSRGDDKYNQKLSAARARSAEQYIESKGIALTRITSKGYGESRPIVKDAKTEEDFQKNRRTEFKVTKIAK